MLTQVAPDLFQVRIPLPFALNHVYCYLLRGDEGWTMVDTGLHLATAEQTWERALHELRITPQSIVQIVLTHTHPDHFGMAGYWQQRSGAVVLASPRDQEIAQQVWYQPHGLYDEVGDFLEQHGMPAEIARGVSMEWANLRVHTLPHPQLSPLPPGEYLSMGNRKWLAIATPGHSDGHQVYYCADERLLLVGDVVLQKITPNISLWPNELPNPLARFLQSLELLRELDVHLALPGHGPLIDNLVTRIDELQQHHLRRLNQIYAASSPGASAFDICTRVFPTTRLDHRDLRLALAETLSHLEYLTASGQLTRMQNGVTRYAVR